MEPIFGKAIAVGQVVSHLTLKYRGVHGHCTSKLNTVFVFM